MTTLGNLLENTHIMEIIRRSHGQMHPLPTKLNRELDRVLPTLRHLASSALRVSGLFARVWGARVPEQAEKGKAEAADAA